MPDWLEIILRTLFAVFALFLMTKLLGKRQISQLSFFEYITGITIGSLAAYISLDMEAEWYLGVISLAVWVLVSVGIEFLQLKSKIARNLIDGKGTILIKEGKVLEDNLKKERLSSEDLLEQLRKRNVFKAADVEFAVMETSGEVNVLVKKEHQPLTSAHLGMKPLSEQEPHSVIMDGRMMDEQLAAIGMNRTWVHTELEKLGIAVEQVYLAQVDSYGQLYVDLYDDKIKAQEPQTRVPLLTQLKNCEAGLARFALSATDHQAKQLYKRCSQDLQAIISDVQPLLREWEAAESE
jgi:uncharacterized membrane protein YcaP (DUF421 family)